MSDDANTDTSPFAFPTRGRLVGVDFGAVRIGLAVCDPDWVLASPLETYTRRDDASDAAFFGKLTQTEKVAGWVVGLPLHMSGEESEQSRRCREFGAKLALLTNLPVTFVDERCTTAAAEELLWDAGLTHKKRKKRRDTVAAQFILQTFLDSAKRKPNVTNPHQ